MARNENRPAWFYPLLIAAAFVLSRLLFFAMGVRFDASGLDWYWQYLDVELLKSDLLRSVFYQHSQPPVFNLFLGTVLKAFPHAYATVFALIFKGLSLSLYYMLFRILSLVGFKQWVAYLAATLFILIPGVVLYENWLFYTWPTAVMLVFAAHRLLLYGKERRTRDALLYLLAITALCLTRSMFHLVYLIAALIPVLWLATSARKKVGAAAGVAIILVGGLFLKNLLLFGFFGSSSWMGMNLWKIAPIGGKVEQLADSPVAHTAPFSPIGTYPEQLRQVPDRFADIPALAAENRQNGRSNLNHCGYIAVSDEYRRKAVELITGDLPGYAYMTTKAWGVYFRPAWSYPLLKQTNITVLEGWLLCTGFANASLLVPIGLILLIWGLLVAFSCFGGTASSLTALRKSSGQPDAGDGVPPRNRQLTSPLFFLFCAGTVFYVAILGNLLEHGENMRFRVQTDPLLYIAALFVIRQFILHRRSAGHLPENSGEKV